MFDVWHQDENDNETWEDMEGKSGRVNQAGKVEEDNKRRVKRKKDGNRLARRWGGEMTPVSESCNGSWCLQVLD